MVDKENSGSSDLAEEQEGEIRSRFDDLLERLEERRVKRGSTEGENEETTRTFTPADRPSERSNSDEADRSTSTEPSEALLRARRLLSERSPSDPLFTDNESRTDGSRGKKKFYIGLALGLILATVLPGVVIASSVHVTDTILAPSPSEYIDEGDTLYIQSDDAAYLGRIYEETTHEVAYCGLITHDEETPTVEIWMANTVNAGPDSIEFITDNCPDAVQEVILHTHPSGNLELSNQDVQTLERGPEEIMCVQGGPLETEPGAHVENLACYQQLHPEEESSELARIPVAVALDDS